MRLAVVRFEYFELFASREIIALPAAIQPFLSGAVSYLALRRAAIAPTNLFAAHLRHCAKQIITLLVIPKFLEKWDSKQSPQ